MEARGFQTSLPLGAEWGGTRRVKDSGPVRARWYPRIASCCPCPMSAGFLRHVPPEPASATPEPDYIVGSVEATPPLKLKNGTSTLCDDIGRRALVMQEPVMECDVLDASSERKSIAYLSSPAQTTNDARSTLVALADTLVRQSYLQDVEACWPCVQYSPTRHGGGLRIDGTGLAAWRCHLSLELGPAGAGVRHPSSMVRRPAAVHGSSCCRGPP